MTPSNTETKFEDMLCSVSIMVEHEDYKKAAECLNTTQNISVGQQQIIKQVITRNILHARSLEWTNHGIIKTFRFWSREEKDRYLSVARVLVDALRSQNDNVCMGFGTVLGHVRDQDLINHDDDVDVLFGIKPTKFRDAKSQLRSFLEEHDFRVFGDNLSHFTVCKNGSNCNGVDVFIAFIEDGYLSCFPGRRKAVPLQDVFPSTMQQLLGCELPFPTNSKVYLERVYGTDWADPIAHWNHPWDRQEYAEFI